MGHPAADAVLRLDPPDAGGALNPAIGADQLQRTERGVAGSPR